MASHKKSRTGNETRITAYPQFQHIVCRNKFHNDPDGYKCEHIPQCEYVAQYQKALMPSSPSPPPPPPAPEDRELEIVLKNKAAFEEWKQTQNPDIKPGEYVVFVNSQLLGQSTDWEKLIDQAKQIEPACYMHFEPICSPKPDSDVIGLLQLAQSLLPSGVGMWWVDAVIHNPAYYSRRFIAVKMKIDTGACITVLPFGSSSKLTLYCLGFHSYCGVFDIQAHPKKIYECVFEIDGKRIRLPRVIEGPRETGLIGMDVLNQMHLEIRNMTAGFVNHV